MKMRRTTTTCSLGDELAIDDIYHSALLDETEVRNVTKRIRSIK